MLFWGTETPDTFIEITDTIEKKIEALKKHASQVGSEDGDVGDFVRASARRTGERAEVPYAEAFLRIQIHR